LKIKALVGLTLLASSAFAATISSGASGVNWMVNSNPAVVETGTLPTAFGWVANFSDGQWIGTAATDGNFGGPGLGALAGQSYTFTLNLSAILASGTFSLQYAADNSVVWSITNGTLSGATSCDSGNGNSIACFGSLRSLTGSFGAGSVLTATVLNGPVPSTPGERSPMGLIVVGTATDVPEPSTYAMLTLGGAAIAFARFRRKA
jgi:hypothetical protein